MPNARHPRRTDGNHARPRARLHRCTAGHKAFPTGRAAQGIYIPRTAATLPPAAPEVGSTRPLEQVILLRKRRTHIPGYGPTLHQTTKTTVTCSALICGLKHRSILAYTHKTSSIRSRGRGWVLSDLSAWRQGSSRSSFASRSSISS